MSHKTPSIFFSHDGTFDLVAPSVFVALLPVSPDGAGCIHHNGERLGFVLRGRRKGLFRGRKFGADTFWVRRDVLAAGVPVLANGVGNLMMLKHGRGAGGGSWMVLAG